MSAQNVIHFSAHQPSPKSSPTPQNEVNFPLDGECGELAKSPVNAGLQGIPDTPPLANSVEPGDDVTGVNSKTNLLPVKASKSKAKAKAKGNPDFLHLRSPGPDGYKTDCDKMTFTELKTAYPWEFTSWRGNKNKCNNPAGPKKKFAWEPWPAAWDAFKDFLLDMTPKPDQAWTLERKENSLRKYGPGLCIWAPPEVQNNNKGDNVLRVDPATGKVWTPKKLANLHGISVNAIRKRIDSWTITELVVGKQSQYLRDIYLLLDALPDLKHPGKKVVHRPINLNSLDYYLRRSPIDDDHARETGERRIAHVIEICDEYDAVDDWVLAFNEGSPVPAFPELKYLPINTPSPERIASRFTPLPKEPKPAPDQAPTYSFYKHDPADCMPDHEQDYDDS
jgi:hypothetical protein